MSTEIKQEDLWEHIARGEIVRIDEIATSDSGKEMVVATVVARPDVLYKMGHILRCEPHHFRRDFRILSECRRNICDKDELKKLREMLRRLYFRLEQANLANVGEVIVDVSSALAEEMTRR